jgi:hypothetical protein
LKLPRLQFSTIQEHSQKNHPRGNPSIPSEIKHRKVQTNIVHKSPSSTKDCSLVESWGHSMPNIYSATTLQIIFNNVNSLKLTSDPISTQYSFSLACSYGASTLCLAETNTNWRHPYAVKTIQNINWNTWQHSTSTYSHTDEGCTEINQPGGTMTTVNNNWTSRVIERGNDPFGFSRWSYATVRGKGSVKVLIITAYTESAISRYNHLAQQHQIHYNLGHYQKDSTMLTWLMIQFQDFSLYLTYRHGSKTG